MSKVVPDQWRNRLPKHPQDVGFRTRPFFRVFEMIPVFFLHDIVVEERGTQSGPEPVVHFRIQILDKIAVELDGPVQKIRQIVRKVAFLYFEFTLYVQWHDSLEHGTGKTPGVIPGFERRRLPILDLDDVFG